MVNNFWFTDVTFWYHLGKISTHPGGPSQKTQNGAITPL